MTAVPDYGRAFGLWRGAAGEAWAAYTRHPFVEAMRDGSLPREAFLAYLVQDYLFLFHFARAWALAAAKAETLDEMRIAARTVDALVNAEMRLHVETCAAAGIAEATLAAAEETPATLAYTRYVLEAGHAGDLLDLLAALAPCVLGYGEIGVRLGGDGAAPYRAWIDTYAGEEYQALCREVGGFLDTVAARRLGPDLAAAPRWPRLAQRFRVATRLEADFWDMGLAAA